MKRMGEKQHRIFRSALLILGGCLIVLLLPPIAAHAGSATGSVAFSKGSGRFTIYGGGATAYDHTYSVIGIGAGYFFTDGLEAGLDVETWFGASPGITQVSPQVRYILNTSSPFSPYAGVFYQRTIVESNPDTDTVGGRAGVFYTTGRNVYLGAGVVYEKHLSCDSSVYDSCAETYPEIAFMVTF